MRVAILYNPRPEYDSGALDDAYEEYDEPETIVAIAKALAGMGVEPTPVTADAEFPWRLKHGGFDFVFNIAEGAGKFSSGDKRRYYLSAMGSSTESAAMFDVCLRRKLIADDTHRRGKQLLDRIVAMLVKLAKSHQER